MATGAKNDLLYKMHNSERFMGSNFQQRYHSLSPDQQESFLEKAPQIIDRIFASESTDFHLLTFEDYLDFQQLKNSLKTKNTGLIFPAEAAKTKCSWGSGDIFIDTFRDFIRSEHYGHWLQIEQYIKEANFWRSNFLLPWKNYFELKKLKSQMKNMEKIMFSNQLLFKGIEFDGEHRFLLLNSEQLLLSDDLSLLGRLYLRTDDSHGHRYFGFTLQTRAISIPELVQLLDQLIAKITTDKWLSNRYVPLKESEKRSETLIDGQIRANLSIDYIFQLRNPPRSLSGIEARSEIAEKIEIPTEWSNVFGPTTELLQEWIQFTRFLESYCTGVNDFAFTKSTNDGGIRFAGCEVTSKSYPHEFSYDFAPKRLLFMQVLMQFEKNYLTLLDHPNNYQHWFDDSWIQCIDFLDIDKNQFNVFPVSVFRVNENLKAMKPEQRRYLLLIGIFDGNIVFETLDYRGEVIRRESIKLVHCRTVEGPLPPTLKSLMTPYRQSRCSIC